MRIDFRVPMKRLTETAIMPSRGSEHAVGYDLYANESLVIPRSNPPTRKLISTGIAAALPNHHFGRIAPRSGLALNHGIDVMAGIIDPDYRGEIKVLLINHGDSDFFITQGDRIAQLILVCCTTPELMEVDTLDDTTRGIAGYGSTGVR